MPDTVPPGLLTPLTVEAVRWHYHPDDQRDEDAIEATCAVLAELVGTAWQTVKERAAGNRANDPALHRLMVNLHVEGLDVTASGCALSLYVSGRGSHDLLHARTGERMTAALTAEAHIPLRVAACSSRLRWTRGIYCQEHSPTPVPPDPDAARAAAERLEEVITGRRPADDGPQAASHRLLLVLRHRLNMHPAGALWAGHPDGVFTLRCGPDDARRLIALGMPVRPHLDGEVGATVGFTLTDRECHAFADKVVALGPLV
ncbi:hypothetical protein ACLQ2N_32775 [Streptomyces sp. DT224]|uniref:hypothetical protein n=1 Tax=Streptomyces sp. DT224 TaxID=3393426 RepID=UPI003CF16762